MTAKIIPFPKASAIDDRWSLEAAKRRPQFNDLVDRISKRWPKASREEAERRTHAMTLELATRLSEVRL